MATDGAPEKKEKCQQRPSGGARRHKPATGNGPAGQETHKAPKAPTRADVALEGRGQSAGPRRRSHNSGARLSRKEPGREAPLGDYGNLARLAIQSVQNV